MYIKNKSTTGFFLLFFSMVAVGFFSFNAEAETFGFDSAKGLQIKILKSPDIGFVHAEIIIDLDGDSDPTISHLTVDNMFNLDLHKSDTSLTGILKRLGDDFRVEQRVDYLKISVNFLPDRMGLFVQFIDELFSYKSFSLKRFNDSIINYWRYFKKQDDWQKNLAKQFAYFHLFPGHWLGNTVVQIDSLSKINLAQIRSYYRRKFQLARSYLFIKGDVNPYITYGLIENGLKSYKKQVVKKAAVQEVKLGGERKIIILDIIGPEAPMIFWFKAIPPYGTNEYLSWVTMNNILFEYPMGTVFKKAASFGIRNIRKVDSEVFYHQQISVICNTFRISYQNIERFIILAENEARNLGKRKINRKEYLDSMNYFIGKAKVESAHFDYDMEIEIKKTLLDLQDRSIAITSEIFNQISLNGLNQFLENFSNLNRSHNHVDKPEIIVIAGNARLIKGYLNRVKADYVYNAQ